MASEVFVLVAFLDDSDSHAATRAFISSKSHLEVIERTPHVTLEGLGKG